MTVVKDWMLEAAKEIAEDADLGNQALVMRSVIERHCPLEEGVAYMPVPRCESCKHWDRDVEDGNEGVCLYPRDTESPGYPDDLKMWAQQYDHICTTKDFGCVQWEAK